MKNTHVSSPPTRTPSKLKWTNRAPVKQFLCESQSRYMFSLVMEEAAL